MCPQHQISAERTLAAQPPGRCTRFRLGRRRSVRSLPCALLSRPWFARRWRASSRPTHAALNIAPDLLAATPDSRASLLTSSLDDFLISNLKKNARHARPRCRPWPSARCVQVRSISVCRLRRCNRPTCCARRPCSGPRNATCSRRLARPLRPDRACGVRFRQSLTRCSRSRCPRRVRAGSHLPAPEADDTRPRAASGLAHATPRLPPIAYSADQRAQEAQLGASSASAR